MSQVRVKNLPRLRLADLLKRRKTTLEAFLKEFGVVSYDALVNKCTDIGVLPPDISAYETVTGKKLPVIASSQQDGIIVVEPLDEPVENTAFVAEGDDDLLLPENATEKRPRRRKKRETDVD